MTDLTTLRMIGSPRPIRLLATAPLELDAEIEADCDFSITDEELTALALAADPTRPLGEDAIPMSMYLSQLPNPLPDWYMPMASTRARHWRWPVVLPVVFGFLLIASFGLCATYGTLGFA